MLIGPRPHHCSPVGRTPLHSKCKNLYLVLALGEGTTVQTVVGSIVLAFRRLKKPRCREMSARDYSLHSVCPQLFFFSRKISSSSLGATDMLDSRNQSEVRRVSSSLISILYIISSSPSCTHPLHYLPNLPFSWPIPSSPSLRISSQLITLTKLLPYLPSFLLFPSLPYFSSPSTYIHILLPP